MLGNKRKADMAYRSRAHRHPAHPPPPARAPPWPGERGVTDEFGAESRVFRTFSFGRAWLHLIKLHLIYAVNRASNKKGRQRVAAPDPLQPHIFFGAALRSCRLRYLHDEALACTSVPLSEQMCYVWFLRRRESACLEYKSACAQGRARSRVRRSP